MRGGKGFCGKMGKAKFILWELGIWFIFPGNLGKHCPCEMGKSNYFFWEMGIAFIFPGNLGFSYVFSVKMFNIGPSITLNLTSPNKHYGTT